ADRVGALLMVDMAHIAGLVATGQHPTPVGVAQVVTSTTHKTLRGPRGGFILADQELGPAIDKAVFPGIQGGPLMHVIAAKAVAFQEAQSPQFAHYQRQVVANAKCLAGALLAAGWALVGGGTENHMLIVKLIGRGLTGAQAEQALGEAQITVNKNAIPNDPLPPRQASGIRIGTPAVTSRAMTEAAITEIAALIDQVLSHPTDAEVLAQAGEAARALAKAYPLYASGGVA
ncbi:MAG: aminotransferase class I/II-fold pyridoxal phosphate-dependent enzyme, partial [Sulfobacillus sp.]